MSKRLALCVGVNNYLGTNMDLRGCVNDADDWAALLRARHPDIDLTLLLDADATADRLLARLQTKIEALKAGDTLYFTFSGHGTYVPDENGDEADRQDEAICPHDVMDEGPIVDDELNWLFSQRLRGSRVVVIADSCFSGTVAKLAGPAYRRARFLPPKKIPERVWAKRGCWPSARDEAWMTVSGCKDNEVSYDAEIAGRPCGAFTWAATSCLVGATSYADWMRRIRRRLPSADYPQTPNLSGPWCAKYTRALG